MLEFLGLVKKKRALLGLLAALALGLSLIRCGSGSTSTSGAIPIPPISAVCPGRTRAPYIAFDTPTTATLAWECAPQGAVDWGIAPTLSQHLDDSHPTGNKHFATLPNLSPNTTYAYRVIVNNGLLGQGTFQTAEAPGDNPFSFVVFADSGAGSPAQFRLASLMGKTTFSFAIIAGDVIYETGQDSEFDPHYFIPYMNLINHLPFFPVVGNHDIAADGGATFMANFFHPLGTLYYDFHWGDSHFIALDSNHPTDSQQLAWLNQTLATSTARWKIVYFHHPPYNSGIFGNNFDVQRNFVPLFDKYHVDVVFTGHAHDYERTIPINGITYFVTGGGGAALTAVGVSSFTAHSQSIYHLLVATITRNRLTLNATDANGTVFDSVTLTK